MAAPMAGSAIGSARLLDETRSPAALRLGGERVCCYIRLNPNRGHSPYLVHLWQPAKTPARPLTLGLKLHRSLCH